MNWKLIRRIDAGIGIVLILFLRLLSFLRQSDTQVTRGPVAKVQRILLIKFWGVGNLFMLLPTIRGLRAQFPHSQIDFLTLKSNHSALALCDVVNNIFTINTHSAGAFLRTWREAIKILRCNHYDVVIDFEQFARFSALVCWQVKAAHSVGFVTRGQHRHYLYTHPVQYDNELHLTRSFSLLTKAIGVLLPVVDEVPVPRITELRDQGVAMHDRLQGTPGATVIVLHIGTSDNFMERRWPINSYAELIDALADRYVVKIALTGLAEEAHLIAEVRRKLRNSQVVTDLGGGLSFEQYAALIAGADLVISADTAAVHIASFLQVPVIGLYGPNTPQLYGPWGKNGVALYSSFPCSPCITNFNAKIHVCRHKEGRGACMRALSVPVVLSAVEQALLTVRAANRVAL